MAFWVFIAFVAVFVAVTAYTDLRKGRIPNYLTVPVAITALIGSLAFRLISTPGYPYPTTPGGCLLGFATGFAIFFVPFFFGGGGAGDLKLAAALGACLGFHYLLWALLFSLFFAAVIAFVMWAINVSAASKSGKVQRIVLPRGATGLKNGRRNSLPFAIPIALGTWCVLGLMVLEVTHPQFFSNEGRNRVAAEQSAKE